MRPDRRWLPPLASLVPGLAVAVALAAQADRYLVEMKLSVNGQLRGAPVLIVSQDEPGQVVVEDDQGVSEWRVELRTNPPHEDEVFRSDAIWLDFSIFRRNDGDWEFLADSMLGLHEGRKGTVSIVGDEAEGSLVDLEVRASRLRAGDAPTP